MTAAEATALMGGWAHGSLNPFLSETGHLDLTTPQAQANLHLIKKIKRSQTKYGESVEIELHDPKDAADKVLKLHGAYQQPDHQEVKFLIVRDLEDVEPSRGPSRAPKS